MSAKKGSAADSVVVGGSKKNRVGPRTRLFALIIGGAAVLVALGFGGYMAYKHFAHKSSDTGKSTQPQKPNYVTKNIAPPTSQNVSSDQAALDKELQAAPDDAAKAALYIKKSDLVVINKGYTSEALGYSQKAEELSPSLQSAFQLATINEALKNKADAIKYYSLYLSRMTPEYKQANPGFFEHYQQVLQELQKS